MNIIIKFAWYRLLFIIIRSFHQKIKNTSFKHVICMKDRIKYYENLFEGFLSVTPAERKERPRVLGEPDRKFLVSPDKTL